MERKICMRPFLLLWMKKLSLSIASKFPQKTQKVYVSYVDPVKLSPTSLYSHSTSSFVYSKLIPSSWTPTHVKFLSLTRLSQQSEIKLFLGGKTVSCYRLNLWILGDTLNFKLAVILPLITASSLFLCHLK